MPPLAVVKAANALYSPSYIPTALFVGGTSGIGQGMAENFAKYTKGNANIIIVGRNRAAAEAIIASFPKPTVIEGTSIPVHEFIPCDALLMKNVQTATSEIISRIPKLNFLVLSPGVMTLRGRNETSEGIDKKLAVHYYSRWKFTKDLIPLLRKAKDQGEDAKVITVFSAGKAMGGIDVNDFGLKKNFSLGRAADAATTYSDLMMEEFSSQNPDMAFTHTFPGGVKTSLVYPSNWALKPFWYALNVVLFPLMVSPTVCAEYMWYGVFAGEKGVFRRSDTGEDIGKKNYYGDEKQRKALWEHTVKDVDDAINGVYVGVTPPKV